MKTVKVLLFILISIFVVDTTITDIPLESDIKIFYEENSKNSDKIEDYNEKDDLDDNQKYFGPYFTVYAYLKKMAGFSKINILNSFHLHNIFRPPIA